MRRSRLTLNMDVRIIRVKRSLSPGKTGSTQAANQNSKCGLQIISQPASLRMIYPLVELSCSLAIHSRI